MGLFKSIFTGTDKRNSSENANKESDAKLIDSFYSLSDYNSRVEMLNEINNPETLLESYKYDDGYNPQKPIKNALLKRLEELNKTIV